MKAIKQILLPGEQVLFAGRVHPVIYIRGLFYLTLAYAVWRHGWALISWWPWAAVMASKAIYYVPILTNTRMALSGILAAVGIIRLLEAFLVVRSTELAVTSERVIAKFGITTVTTLEMDREKVAGVVVVQPFLGQILGYGWVWIRGFSGDIRGLPAIARPHALQAEINRNL